VGFRLFSVYFLFGVSDWIDLCQSGGPHENWGEVKRNAWKWNEKMSVCGRTWTWNGTRMEHKIC